MDKYKLPFISIVIPAYNEEKLLPLCLKSIHELAYPSARLEVIVVDNGSQDKTIAVAKKWGCQVLEKKGGTVGSLRNFGAKKSSGNLIAFLDADCIMDRNWLKACTPHFKNNNIGAVSVPSAPPSSDATWIERCWYLLRSDSNIKGVSRVAWLSTCNMIVRKKLFEKVSGFNEALVTCEDSDLGYKLSSISTLLIDSGVNYKHLRESKTIPEFFKRVRWRGRGNLKSFSQHRLNIKEVPSLIAPLIFLIFLLLIPLSLVFYLRKGLFAIFSINVLMIILIPILMVFKKNRRFSGLSQFMGCLFLSMTYLLAQSLAFFTKQKRSW